MMLFVEGLFKVFFSFLFFLIEVSFRGRVRMREGKNLKIDSAAEEVG